MRRLGPTIMLLVLLASPAAGDTVRVAVAANFRSTLAVLAQDFEAQNRHRLKISSASSGVIYNQLLNGAPFDLFLAADERHPRLLEEQGLILPGSRHTYARGVLVVAYQAGFRQLAKQGLHQLLSHPGLRVAIANPLHAPYGRAAAQVLATLPEQADRRLLRAANVSQAFQMWHSGNVDVALVAAAFQPAYFLQVPGALYQPLVQQLVIPGQARAPGGARALSDYLLSAPARKIIQARGYRVQADHG